MPNKIQESQSIGERIKKKREELGLSIRDAAQEIQAPQKYIQALEEDDYGIFPARVYAAGFLKKFIKLLSYEDGQILNEFDREWEIRMFRKERYLVPLPENKERVYINPAKLIKYGAVLFITILLIFFGYRLIIFVSLPKLVIDEPQNETILYEPRVTIRGQTEKESRLTVNGREIKIDEAGNFMEEIELGTGLNALEFLVNNRFEKKNQVVKYIIVK